MSESLFSHVDYKSALKQSFKEARTKKSALTLKSVAAKVGVQATYLSRCLNDEKSHLSEDHLYSMARLLKLAPGETDYLLLLRSYATTQDEHRRERIFSKIEAQRRKPLSHVEEQQWDPQDLREETSYLFNPICLIVHASLFIDEHKKNPRALCSAVGITVQNLKEILRLLAAREYIVLSEDDPFKVLEVKARSPHFGREHPLTRTHQATLKTALNSRLSQTSEEEKETFLATFTMDDERFEKVRQLFKDFLGSVQKISMDDPKGPRKPTEHVYQMSFDLLKWL
jgi:uncharacterized protein (TIGR02147 family)